MATITMYRWRYYDEWTERWIETRHKASEADFLKHHPGAEKIPGSEEVRQVPDNWLENSTGRFSNGPTKDS